MPEHIFSLIESKPIWLRCIDELREACREFAEDPKKFIINLVRNDLLQVDQIDYWRVWITRAIILFFFTSLFSISLYYRGTDGGVGKAGGLEKITYLTTAEAPRWLKLQYPGKHADSRDSSRLELLLPDTIVRPITAALQPPRPPLPIDLPNNRKPVEDFLLEQPETSVPIFTSSVIGPVMVEFEDKLVPEPIGSDK